MKTSLVYSLFVGVILTLTFSINPVSIFLKDDYDDLELRFIQQDDVYDKLKEFREGSIYARTFIQKLKVFILNGDTLTFEKIVIDSNVTYLAKIPGYKISLGKIKTELKPVFYMAVSKETRLVALIPRERRVIEGIYSLSFHFKIIEYGCVGMNKVTERIGKYEFLNLEVLSDETARFMLPDGRVLKLKDWWFPIAYVEALYFLFNSFIFDKYEEHEKFFEVEKPKSIDSNQREI